MKEILQITAQTLERMQKFNRRIEKSSHYFRRFKSIVQHDFASIIQEDINVCVCCGIQFKGKSIGPHYKNNRKCAQFKATLRKTKPKVTREPVLPKSNDPEKEAEKFHTVQNHVNYDVFESSEENVSVNLDDVDDFFYSE